MCSSGLTPDSDAALSKLELEGVVGALCTLTGQVEESLEMRYATFIALDRAGPTSEYLALLSHLEADETFGGLARSALEVWKQRSEHHAKDQPQGDFW